jgi:hypothetical protein
VHIAGDDRRLASKRVVYFLPVDCCARTGAPKTIGIVTSNNVENTRIASSFFDNPRVGLSLGAVLSVATDPSQ